MFQGPHNSLNVSIIHVVGDAPGDVRSIINSAWEPMKRIMYGMA